MKSEKSIKIIPLGGLGTIGKNITLFESGEDIIVVDCGIMFPTDETPGIDFFIPDFSYLADNPSRIRGITTTHGHEDHIGAIPYLLNAVSAPIYATRLTLGLIQSRLEEKPPRNEPSFVEVKPRDTVELGGFLIEFIKVNHSVADGVSLAITTEIGTVIHTSDFKIDYSPVDGEVTDIARFAEYGGKGVLLLLSDSTNAERPGYTKSESVLQEKLTNIFSSSKGRIIVASFASNIHRIQQVLDAAHKYNRKVVISGLSMIKNVEIAKNLGYLSYRDDLIVDLEEANLLPNKKLVIVCTGSQGEPMSALVRMANGTHKNFTAEKGDTVVITASVIPGNERTVTNVVNSLMKLGADVLYDQDEDIHVSGHGSSEELKLMIALTKPKFFIPIHGEYKQLKAHALIAQSLGIKPSRILIADNGDILELTNKSLEKIGTVSLTQVYVDGTELGDADSRVIKDRQRLSTDGFLAVVILTSEGMLMRRPDIFTRGFLGNEKDKALEIIRRDAEEQANKMLVEEMRPEDMRPRLVSNLRNLIFRLTRRNPLVIVEILEV